MNYANAIKTIIKSRPVQPENAQIKDLPPRARFENLALGVPLF